MAASLRQRAIVLNSMRHRQKTGFFVPKTVLLQDLLYLVNNTGMSPLCGARPVVSLRLRHAARRSALSRQTLWGRVEAASDRPQQRAPPSEKCLLGPQLTQWQVLARKWRKSKIYSFSVWKKCALIWAPLLIHKLYCDKIFAIALQNSCFFDTLVCSESYHYLTIKGLLCGVFGM